MKKTKQKESPGADIFRASKTCVFHTRRGLYTKPYKPTNKKKTSQNMRYFWNVKPHRTRRCIETQPRGVFPSSIARQSKKGPIPNDKFSEGSRRYVFQCRRSWHRHYYTIRGDIDHGKSTLGDAVYTVEYGMPRSVRNFLLHFGTTLG